MLADIIYDAKKTFFSFKDKHTRVSWSNFDNFQTCKGLWFFNFFIKPPEDTQILSLAKEHSRAIPGTLIQKVMEIFVNERIYKKPELSSLELLLNWFQHNSNAVYHLTKFDPEIQFHTDFINTRKFWETTAGKQHLHKIRKEFGLDPAIKEVNLSFVDKEKFITTYGGEEQFFCKMNNIYSEVLNMFLKEKIYFDRVLSEINISAPVNDFNLTGSIDFLYNVKQKDDSCFTTLTQLEDGYFLFDGKYNISPYTKKEQLFFYAYLLYLKTKKLPGRLALLSWSEAKFKDFVLDKDYPLHIKKVIEDMKETAEKVMSFLKDKEGVRQFFRDNFLDLNPGVNNCQFCAAFSSCPAAKEKGVTLFDAELINKMQAKNAAKKAISLLDPSNPDMLL